MRNATRRLTAAAQGALVPGERLATTGLGWAATRREKVPLLFQGRRQYWFALTDRRLLVFEKRRGGPDGHDLALGKRFDFFTLEAVKRHRPLFQVRVKGATGSSMVLEFRPGQRGLAKELAGKLSGPTPEQPAPAKRDDAAPAAFWGPR